MSVSHRVIAHAPEAVCGVSLFIDARHNAATVVLSDLPDSHGAPVASHLETAVGKVTKAYLKGVPATRTVWLLKTADTGAFRRIASMMRGGTTRLEAGERVVLEQIVHRYGEFVREVFVPEFRPVNAIMRARHERTVFTYASPG